MRQTDQPPNVVADLAAGAGRFIHDWAIIWLLGEVVTTPIARTARRRVEAWEGWVDAAKLQTNTHVVRLNGYLPFDANHAQLYEELADTDQKSLETRAFEFLVGALNDPAARLVVLTGDAGHGKTHLCYQLLLRVEKDVEQARRLLRTQCTGEHGFPIAGGRELRIIKDLSEVDPPGTAAQRLLEGLEHDNRLTVVCANEGRLRIVLGLLPGLAKIRDTLEASFEAGLTEREGGVHVLNLNYQSITARTATSSLLEQLVADWVCDQRRWRACASCDAADACPILENHRSFREDREDRAKRGLSTMLRVAEQSGSVITIRELLILVAFLTTGGLDCARVHERFRRQREDRAWQAKHLFQQVLFEPPLHRDQQRRLSVLATLKKLDPGRLALRSIDDALVAQMETENSRFLPANAQPTDGTPRTRKQFRTEANRHHQRLRFLRRRAYFLGEPVDVPLPARLGLRYYDDFEYLLGPQDETRRTIALRDTLLAGLEAIQGVRRGAGHANFAVIDPAFANSSGEASILAGQLASSKARIVSQTSWWERGRDTPAQLPKAVDWLDRKLVLVFEIDDAVALELDMLQFEFVMRSAHGLACHRFFQAPIRRIMSQLARLAGRLERTDSIRVIHGSQPRSLALDVGGLIRCTEN